MLILCLQVMAWGCSNSGGLWHGGLLRMGQGMAWGIAQSESGFGQGTVASGLVAAGLLARSLTACQKGPYIM